MIHIARFLTCKVWKQFISKQFFLFKSVSLRFQIMAHWLKLNRTPRSIYSSYEHMKSIPAVISMKFCCLCYFVTNKIVFPHYLSYFGTIPKFNSSSFTKGTHLT